MRQYFDLCADKMKYLSKLKVALQGLNRKLHHNNMKTHPGVTSKRVRKPSHHSHKRSYSRQKWFSLLTWLFGWGVYKNVMNIRKIKQNLQILQNQNNLQENQILELMYYLNLTMIQVQEHSGVIWELDIKLLVFNNSLAKTMEALKYLHYMTTVLTDICTTITRLTSGIFSFKEGVESFYKYMQVLANHEVNPLIVPSLEL